MGEIFKEKEAAWDPQRLFRSFFFSTGRTVQAGWEQHIISLDFLHPQTSVQGTFKFTVNYSNIMLISLHLATFPKPSRVPAF